jgi:hypothetical protein
MTRRIVGSSGNAEMDSRKPDEVALPLPPTPLLAALWGGDRTAALALIAGGADPNAADTRDFGFGCAPLHLAADADDPELIRALVAAGADVNARTVWGQTPLWFACNGGRALAARELLAAGADPNSRSNEGYSPLGRVARSDPALMELLLSYGGVV